MIIDTHGNNPIPVTFDDNDPILAQVAAGKLYFYQQRDYVVLARHDAHNG